MAAFTVFLMWVALHGRFADSAMELPGLLGEMKRISLTTRKYASKLSILKVGQPSGLELDPTRVTQLSWSPRAFLYKNFLTNNECDHLIELARNKLEKSTVVDKVTGKSYLSEIRTSSGMFLHKYQDEIVARIEDRLAAWTFLPKENGEAIQILHYKNGEKYETHVDFFTDKFNQRIGGQRAATVLMYLSDVVKGGETLFPLSEESDNQPKDNSWSECAKDGYSVKPSKGDALLFFSVFPNGTTDDNSLHAGCPVIEGEKWSATKWIHLRAYDFTEKNSSGECIDKEDVCTLWAATGECNKNYAYMVGTPDSPGWCRKSCHAC